MNIKPYGDSAVLIDFEQKINETIHQKVIILEQKINAANIIGITFFIPAYCSLTIGYDPFLVQYDTLVKTIKELQNNPSCQSLTTENKTIHIPVCYEKPYALDIKSVGRLTKLFKEDVVKYHTSTEYTVYMLGFLPGFAYLSTLPEVLFTKRKLKPELRVPAQSVGLAGYQTGIYPSEAPGGWRIIGRTPIPVFDAKQPDPFLFKVGDKVQFHAISVAEFKQIETDINKEVFDIHSLFSNFSYE